MWFKVKTRRWRGASTRLPEADRLDARAQVRRAPWWLGAAGYRREGDPSDFYTALASAWARAGGDSRQWLPSDWDWKRMELEDAYGWEFRIREIVRELIGRSIRTGHPYQAEFHHYRVTALARARGEETYLIIGTENVADPRVFAIILNAVPGVEHDSWLPEPSEVVGVHPGPGEVVWSTVLPLNVVAELLDAAPDED
ncbi:hypothetical protein SAMN05421748_104284 [Paractinoplanes atraurantiacus]|uniref:Uncharacterized protein n=1 Tax=Paractinoplanes atraurantiacus TaxID=1036182 RepID=A0A285HFV6_9ACTN|nr:hypothetical protein SAMN05421748_104284 [Actinoplanes atraurantiacus]